MYRIHIADSGYKALCAVVKDYARIKLNENEIQSEEDMAAFLGCMLLVDDLNNATHIEDKK